MGGRARKKRQIHKHSKKDENSPSTSAYRWFGGTLALCPKQRPQRRRRFHSADERSFFPSEPQAPLPLFLHPPLVVVSKLHNNVFHRLCVTSRLMFEAGRIPRGIRWSCVSYSALPFRSSETQTQSTSTEKRGNHLAESSFCLSLLSACVNC